MALLCSHTSHPQRLLRTLPSINGFRPEIPLNRDHGLAEARKIRLWAEQYAASYALQVFSLQLMRFVDPLRMPLPKVKKKNFKIRGAEYSGMYAPQDKKSKAGGYVTGPRLHSLSHKRKVFAHQLSLLEQCNVHPIISLPQRPLIPTAID